ncbi:MAG: hypothetical protein KF690_07585 [Bacteroidetes bacterium]|nr:hypothetical protein [Bacteroidota bacterium]
MKNRFPSSITLLLALVLVSACGHNTENTQEELDSEVKAQHNEVVRIHDEVMPKTSVLKKYTEKIKTQFPDSLKEKVESSQKRVIAELEAAGQAMDTWMKDYKIPTVKDEKAKALKYLAVQRAEVQKVKEKIEGALKNAAALVKLDDADLNSKGDAQGHEGHSHEGHSH